MFNKISSIKRLIMCLFLSAGMHAGLAMHGWLAAPSLSDRQVPVSVALVPAADFPAPVETLQEQPPTDVEPKPAPATRQPEPPPPAAADLSPPVPIPRKEDPAVVEQQPSPTAFECAEPPPVAEAVQTEPAPVASRPVATPVLTARLETASVVTTATPTGEAESPDESRLVVSETQIEAAPDYRSNPLPEYPYLARQRRWEGVVWLLVDVSADGLADEVRIEESCGHRLLDRAASKAVRSWRFFPATRAGLPVSSQVRLPVRFRLEEG